MNNNIDTRSMLPVGTMLQGGKYRIDRYLSSGGFGNTYVATNVFFDECVAIKEFFLKGISDRDNDSVTVSVSIPSNRKQFDEQNEKFKKEAYRLRKLKNEHIVAVHDLFEENGTAYYVMDFLDGESVSTRLKRTGKPIGEQEALDILRQVLDALEAVHEHGIFHLDIKPANIMVDKNGKATLIDFGASKQTKQEGGATTSTGLCYTPGYAPIEQMAQNLNQFGPWTDIYSLGATLYFMLTLHPLPSPAELLEDDGVLQMDNSISANTQQLVRRMMTPVRTKRPQSVAEVRELMYERTFVDPPFEEEDNESEETVVAKPMEAADEETQMVEKGNKSESKEPKVSVDTDLQSASDESGNSYPQQETEEEQTEQVFEEKSFGKKLGIGIGAIGVIGVIIAAVMVFSGGSISSSDEQQSSFAQSVADSVSNLNAQIGATTIINEYKTNVGICRYEGEMNAQGLPHGHGKATFVDGRKYEGEFTEGKMEGTGRFIQKSGDVFEGKMKNDYFVQGRYTTTDGSYFEGTFEKGNIKNGKWYDKNGNPI